MRNEVKSHRCSASWSGTRKASTFFCKFCRLITYNRPLISYSYQLLWGAPDDAKCPSGIFWPGSSHLHSGGAGFLQSPVAGTKVLHCRSPQTGKNSFSWTLFLDVFRRCYVQFLYQFIWSEFWGFWSFWHIPSQTYEVSWFCLLIPGPRRKPARPVPEGGQLHQLNASNGLQDHLGSIKFQVL